MFTNRIILLRNKQEQGSVLSVDILNILRTLNLGECNGFETINFVNMSIFHFTSNIHTCNLNEIYKETRQH